MTKTAVQLVQPLVCRRRSAMILLVVMLILSMSSIVAVGLMFRVKAENGAMAARRQYKQAELAAMSGIHRAMNMLSNYSGEPDVWRDNPDYFLAQDVWFDGVDQWKFTVYSPDMLAQNSLRFGLIDEAEKINLASTLDTDNDDTLMALGLLDNDQIDCLKDFIDPDSESRRGGAEQDYYDDLDQPYKIANANPATIEQILMAHGIDARIVYGEDTNLNGRLDPNEDDGDLSFPDDNADGHLNPGLYYYATTFTRPLKSTLPRKDLNDPTARDFLPNSLSPQTLALVMAYFGDQQYFTHPVELLDLDYTDKSGTRHVSDVTANNISSLQDILLNFKANPPNANFWNFNPFSFSASSPTYDMDARGGVNVMSAPQEILELVGNMGPAKASDIVRIRDTINPNQANTPAWLLEEGVFDEDEFKKVAPLLMCGSEIYRLRCIGYGQPSGRFCVLEAVVDISDTIPKIIYLRDLTRFGLPFEIQ